MSIERPTSAPGGADLLASARKTAEAIGLLEGRPEEVKHTVTADQALDWAISNSTEQVRVKQARAGMQGPEVQQAQAIKDRAVAEQIVRAEQPLTAEIPADDRNARLIAAVAGMTDAQQDAFFRSKQFESLAPDVREKVDNGVTDLLLRRQGISPQDFASQLDDPEEPEETMDGFEPVDWNEGMESEDEPVFDEAA